MYHFAISGEKTLLSTPHLKVKVIKFIDNDQKYVSKEIKINKEEGWDYIRREVQTTQNIEHEHILKIEDSREKSTELYLELHILTKYCPKGDLSKLIQRKSNIRKEFTELEIKKAIWVLVEAFAYMEENNISHRDIKPENIFVDENEEFKIGDFGTSYIEESCKEDERTLEGTPYYLSPILRYCYSEFLRNPMKSRIKHNIFKSDVYSLGLTILHMCKLKKEQDFAGIKRSIRSLNYSNSVKEILSLMLKEEERERPDFIEIYSLILAEYNFSEVFETLNPKEIIEAIFRAVKRKDIFNIEPFFDWFRKNQQILNFVSFRAPQSNIQKFEYTLDESNNILNNLKFLEALSRDTGRIFVQAIPKCIKCGEEWNGEIELRCHPLFLHDRCIEKRKALCPLCERIMFRCSWCNNYILPTNMIENYCLPCYENVRRIENLCVAVEDLNRTCVCGMVWKPREHLHQCKCKRLFCSVCKRDPHPGEPCSIGNNDECVVCYEETKIEKHPFCEDLLSLTK